MIRQKISDEDILKKITDAFDSLDEERIVGLKMAKKMNQIKNSTLEKERDRLTKKYGADHPRVKKANEHLVYNQGFLRELDVEIERSDIKVQSFSPDSWHVHGRVLDIDRKGIENLTVSLTDEKKRWVEEIGYSGTDSKGYFSITYTIKTQETTKISETQKLFLAVLKKGRQIYISSEPLFISIGHIDYREITITENEHEVTPPPKPAYDETPNVPKDLWIVKGQIVDENGKGIPALVISLYDKDLIFDDVLGTSVTDSEGFFRFHY
ncbi:MAG: carboxypeptidase-like regulatory domain-containing protein, partial [Ignavibacteria bacterium]